MTVIPSQPGVKRAARVGSRVLARDYHRMHRARAYLLVALERDRMTLEHVLLAQLGGPSQLPRDRIENRVERRDYRVRALEMSGERDAPARLTHAHHLGHHPVRIGHHSQDVERSHVVEAVVGILEIERIALP